jgi:hypothetical protein
MTYKYFCMQKELGVTMVTLVNMVPWSILSWGIPRQPHRRIPYDGVRHPVHAKVTDSRQL